MYLRPSHSSLLKDFVPKLWAIFACEENESYFLIANLKTYNTNWKTALQIKDARNMVTFSSKEIAEMALNDIVEIKAYPKDVVAFEIAEIIPSVEDDLLWYVNTKNIIRKRVFRLGVK
jgi:hypothetical protein